MNISDVAKASTLPAKTIRYYEDIELIKPARGANGYRSFSEGDVHKLRFLARSRALGFSIEDCRALLALYDDDQRASSEVKAIARRHLDEIAKKIADLRALEATLGHLVETCSGDDKPNCPILEDLGR
ncbi:MAG: Cu(I)-responsive transcriptional regulator [Paracoccaceae bacterium]